MREEGRAGNMNKDDVEGGDVNKKGGSNVKSGEDHDEAKNEERR